MKDYNSKIKENEDIELIHINLDKTEKAALNWASKENFPWPMTKPSVTKKMRNQWQFMQHVQYVPTYLLVDENGNLIAKGKRKIYTELGW